MPEAKRTRKGRPGRGAQRSALIVTKGKKSGRDATVLPKRGVPSRDFAEPKPRLVSQLEEGDSVEAFLERATAAYDDDEESVIVSAHDTLRSEVEDALPTYASLPIPRRPAWDASTTPEELRKREEASFVAWRRNVAQSEEAERERRERRETFLSPSATVATPFERNLEVWRQLWRTLERSDCVCVVVDARWPSFYANDDLLEYVRTLGKPALVVNNKADYLTTAQRQRWRDYWRRRLHGDGGCVFFSARTEQRRLDDEAKRRSFAGEEDLAAFASDHGDDDVDDDEDDDDFFDDESDVDPSRCVRPEELLALGYKMARKTNRTKEMITLGMVGYPNVGKSSCVNALRGATRHGVGARAGVSATPGKTKHLQTLRVGEKMELCDCPGLVFPSLVRNGAAELVCSGVVPLARARDPLGAAELVLRRVPAALFDATYGTDLARRVFDDGVSASDLLDAFCERRDYKTAGSGQPDRGRAAREIVRDYVSGELLYCHPPSDDGDDDAFLAETRDTVLANSAKLRAKLAHASDGHFLRAAAAAGFFEPDDADLDAAAAAETTTTQEQQAAPDGSHRRPRYVTKRANRWGKKGRRFRDLDPYPRANGVGGGHGDPVDDIPL